jgi:hypothetical protein
MRSTARSNSRGSQARCHGIFILDALLGLFLIVAVAAALGAVVANQRRAAIQTADRRAAARLAETALTNLQIRQSDHSGVAVKHIDAPAPTGWVWVQATGQSGSRTATLTGLVPVAGGDR